MPQVRTMSEVRALRRTPPRTREGAEVLRGLAEYDIRCAICELERLVHAEDPKVVTEHEKVQLGGMRLRLESVLDELRELVMK